MTTIDSASDTDTANGGVVSNTYLDAPLTEQNLPAAAGQVCFLLHMSTRINIKITSKNFGKNE